MRRSRHHDHRVRWLWALGLAALATGTGKLAMTPPAPSTPTSGHMSLDDLRSLAASVGFPDPDLAAAVAMAESGGNPFAVGDGATSFGLWQIHAPAHPEFAASQLLTAAYNAHAALLISKSGTDWSPWTTFRTGAYKAFMRTA
jgi:Lysozyme like domain